jgi:hypothetical protein
VSTSGASHGRVMWTHGVAGPPSDELPSVLPTPSIIWRGDGIVVAVPSLQVYSTGAELTIMCRMMLPQPRTVEHARATVARLSQLRANGGPVVLAGGSYDDFGFTYRAWVPATGDTAVLTLELGWPEVGQMQHQVPGIRDAAAKVTRLWPVIGRDG